MTISLGKKPVLALTMIASAWLLAGCGGGPAPVDTVAADDLGTQTHAVSYQSSAARADTKSFTLNSTASFKGFNPQVWNDQKSWYECDCGNTSRRPPETMPWNPA